MPNKNKKKSNGFMIFVNEWRNKNGRTEKMSISQAINQCGQIWKNMSTQQREKYKASAEQVKKNESMNCRGQLPSVAEREERLAAEEMMGMKRSIERMVMNGKAQHDLENTKFVFAAFNYFTKKVNRNIYIPAEFAACQFSLKSGLISIYSSHINPGRLIYGHGSDALHHSTTTHQLPLPPAAMGESNMAKLYGNIIKYLRSCCRDQNPNEPLAVFTSTELMPVVEGCFRYVASDCEESMEHIRVYDIQYLLYVLKMEVVDIAGLPQQINKHITDSLFLHDYFEYQSGISCQFHEDNDRGRYCTHSMVTRWCYIFSDFMCGDLAIKTRPGKHMPPKQEPRFIVTNPGMSSAEDTSSMKTEVNRQPDNLPAGYSGFARNSPVLRDRELWRHSSRDTFNLPRP